jgi:hypothetical protein
VSTAGWAPFPKGFGDVPYGGVELEHPGAGVLAHRSVRAMTTGLSGPGPPVFGGGAHRGLPQGRVDLPEGSISKCAHSGGL